MLRLGTVLASALLLVTAPAYATSIVFTVPLLGSNEVAPNVGDPDGFGTATLTIDDVALTVSWNISVSNLDPVILDHIHQGDATVNGPVVVDFGGLLSGGPIFDADLAGVLANPSGYYVNVHTTTFTGGAIRGQIPEPAPAQLIVLGALMLGWSRWQKRRMH